MFLPTITVFFLNLVLFTFCLEKAAQKYQKKRSRASLYLVVLFFGCGFINLCSALDGLLYGPVFSFRLFYAISLIATGISSVALVCFSMDVFFTKEEGELNSSMKIVRDLYSIAEMAICTWGALQLMIEQTSATTIPLILIFTTGISLYIALASKSYNLAKRIDDVIYKKPITYIGHFAVFNLFIFLFFILDSMSVGNEGGTWWGFIGAFVFMLTAVLAYMGFLKPVKQE